MKLIYCRESDSLYIDLSSRPGVSSREVAAGVVADFDKKGDIVGIDISNASCIIDLNDVILSVIHAGDTPGKAFKDYYPKQIRGSLENAGRQPEVVDCEGK